MEKLDFRYADDEDALDIASVVNNFYHIETDISSPFYFREGPKVSPEEIENDTFSQDSRWIVLETPLPDEIIVGVARFKLNRSEKSVVVDLLAGLGDFSSIPLQYVLSTLLSRLESISLSLGFNELVVELSEWRTDIQEWISQHGYSDLAGYQILSDRETNHFLKHTFILCFKKSLRGIGNLQGPPQESKILNDPSLVAPSKFEAVAFVDLDLETCSETDLQQISLESFQLQELDAEFLQPIVSSEKKIESKSTNESEMGNLVQNLFAALHKEYS